MKKLLVVLGALIAVSMFTGCPKPLDPGIGADETKEEETKQDKPDPVKPEKPAMTQIYINSNSGRIDFVTEPIAEVVTEARKGWLSPDDPVLKAPAPWYEQCTVTVYDKDSNTILSPSKAQVKVRGNWSTSYEKKPLRIKFDEKQAMSGMHGGKKYKNWVLLAEYKDASGMRNATALEVAKLLGPDYYSSDYEFVEVYINNKYWGVYLLAEQQEVKSGRIDITEPENTTAPDQMGYFIEYDDYYRSEPETSTFTINYYYDNNPLLDYYGNISKRKTSGYTIKSDVTDVSQKAFISDYMNKVWKICYEAAYKEKYYSFDDSYNLVEGEFDNAKDCVSAVIDLDSLVATYLQQEVVCDADYYLNSFFMDIDFAKGKKLTFEAPWDFDSALGNKRHCADAQGVFAGSISRDVNWNIDDDLVCNPWLMVFINCEWFRDLIKEKWNSVKGQTRTILAKLDSYQTLYSNSFLNETKRWPLSKVVELAGDEMNSSSKESAKTQAASYSWLKTWLEKRFAEIDQIWGNYQPASELKFKKTSEEGHLVVESSKNGIKVIVKNPEHIQDFWVLELREATTNISVKLNDNNMIPRSGSYETEIIFPFTKVFNKYKFELYRMPANGEWKMETVGNIASVMDGINLSDYFDVDKISDNNAKKLFYDKTNKTLKIKEDIRSYVKEEKAGDLTFFSVIAKIDNVADFFVDPSLFGTYKDYWRPYKINYLSDSESDNGSSLLDGFNVYNMLNAEDKAKLINRTEWDVNGAFTFALKDTGHIQWEYKLNCLTAKIN